MAPLSLINLLAISSLAVLACLFPASSVNALATDIHHIRDVSIIGHGAMARRKRATSTNARRCKQRPSSSSSSSSSSTSSKAKPTPSKANSVPSHSSSEKAVATPPAFGTAGKGKVGLAWPNGGNADSIKPFVNDQVQYIYTWSPHEPTGIEDLGLTPLPMLWGTNQIEDFKQVVKEGYANAVLGFNEPEQPGQSNMSPETGAELWITYIEPLRHQHYTLISPATSSAPAGRTWMKDWYKACKGQCSVDVTGTHYYDISADGLEEYLKLWHTDYNLPVMLTEFACQNFNDLSKQCSESDVQKFAKTIVQFAKDTDWFVAFFPFGLMHNMQGVNPANQLMDSNGQPNDLWRIYTNP